MSSSPLPSMPLSTPLRPPYCRRRLDSPRFGASHDSTTAVVGPQLKIAHASCPAAAMAHACTHVRTYARTHAWYARNETRNNPARSMRPFCRTVLSPRRYRYTRREGDTEGYEGMAHTARLGNRRKRIVTCLSADVHRRVHRARERSTHLVTAFKGKRSLEYRCLQSVDLPRCTIHPRHVSRVKKITGILRIFLEKIGTHRKEK